jgi:flagellar protein FlgJ
MSKILDSIPLSSKPTPNLDKIANGSKDEIRKVAEEFESLFLGIVLKSMRDTVQDSGLLGNSNATKIYTSMLDDEYSKIIASNRHTGIAESIENFLKGQTKAEGHKAYSK